MWFKPPFQKPRILFSDIANFFKNDYSVASFTEALKKVWKTENVQLTKSARQAIWLILSSLSPSPGSEVLVSSFTPVVIPLAVLKANCQPVFCDVEKNAFVLSPEDVEKKITSKTIAIIMPYSFGCFSDLNKFKQIAEKHQLVLIEDCAQTFAGRYQNASLGFNADFGIWSFGISKNIGSLNGGVFWYHDKHKEKVASRLSDFFDTAPVPQRRIDYFRALGVPVINTKIGYFLLRHLIDRYQKNRETERSLSASTAEFENRITDFEAGLCQQQLERYETVYRLRQKNYHIYKSELETVAKFPIDHQDFQPDYLYAPLLLKKEIRDQLLKKYQNTLVSDINFHYINQLPVLKGFAFDTPNRLKIQDEYFLLSLHHSEKQTAQTAKEIKKFIISHS